MTYRLGQFDLTLLKYSGLTPQEINSINIILNQKCTSHNYGIFIVFRCDLTKFQYVLA